MSGARVRELVNHVVTLVNLRKMMKSVNVRDNWLLLERKLLKPQQHLEEGVAPEIVWTIRNSIPPHLSLITTVKCHP